MFFIVKNFISIVIPVICLSFFFSSCKIYQPAYYFKDITRDTVITSFVNDNLELKIRKNDILSITISSLSNVEDALFNKAVSIGTESRNDGFQVAADGNIYLHKLGKVAVVGLTRKELKNLLENALLPYLKDPIVTVNFVNHRVTVLGDASSMIVEMPEERISLLDAMAKTGSVTQNSQLNRVMVIRETEGTKEIKHLNLEDPSIFTSPWYYLQPNDIVVIKPNEEKIETEQKRNRNLLIYTTVISAITFIILIIDRTK